MHPGLWIKTTWVLELGSWTRGFSLTASLLLEYNSIPKNCQENIVKLFEVFIVVRGQVAIKLTSIKGQSLKYMLFKIHHSVLLIDINKVITK